VKACGNIKHCPGCDRDLSLESFGRKKSCPDGLQVYCKECHSREVRESAAKPEHRASRYERVLENRKDPEWHERELEGRKAWYRRHKNDPGFQEKQAERAKRWDKTPRGHDLHRAASLRWKHRNREQQKAYRNEYFRRRYANDPDFRKARLQVGLQRAAAKRANGGDFDIQDWETLVELANGHCPACGKERKLNMDHIVPVSKGGTNYLWNLQPLCRSCNSRKMTETIDYRTPAMLQWLDIV